MIAVQGLSLILTRKCNASCRHCGFSSCPGASSTMSLEQACGCLRGARRTGTLKIVSITGGEPFLYFDRVRQIFACARDLGLAGEIVTNSYWAVSPQAALSKLGSLREVGAVNFVTSFDEFHAPFVPVERVGHAARAAVQLGYRVTIKTLLGGDPAFAPSRACDALGLREGEPQVKLFIGRTVRAGRARELPAVIEAEGLADGAYGPCDKVIRFPAVTPEGEIFPCCGFGDGARRAGSTAGASSYRALRRIQGNLLFNLLARLGPAFVWQRAKRYLPPDTPEGFTNPCDVCNALYDSETVRSAVARVLLRLGGNDHPFTGRNGQPSRPCMR